MDSQMFAAQPIYDRDGNIYARELLYRHEDGTTALDVGDTAATSELLHNLCADLQAPAIALMNESQREAETLLKQVKQSN